MTLPLYRAASQKPPQFRADGHAGLWFDKFCDKWRVSAGGWSMSSGSDRSSPKSRWIGTLAGREVGSARQIDESVFHMMRLIHGRGGIYAVFTSESRFVTGLGRSHPVENGFAWHPTLGTPYIPGSSVKGMIRAWAKAEADPKPDKNIVNRLFGERDSAGKMCVLDAIPIRPTRLESDIITPHYAGWDEENPPGDWRSPVPIPFLVAAPGTSFLFGVIPVRGASDEDMKLVETWLRDALEWAGAGAKTAVGYGRFALHDTETNSLSRKLAEYERAQTERVRREAEERERALRLASSSPVEREIEELLENRQDKGMLETTAIYQQIGGDRWSGEDKIEAARWLESRMKDEGNWRETTRRRRPERDTAHQRTLQVIRWLNGE